MTVDHVAAVLAGLDSVRSWQEDFYRDLHAHPELSHQERRTAAKVADRLREAGCEVHEGVGGTGVVGRAAQRRRADGAAARRHGRASGPRGDRAAVRQHGDAPTPTATRCR